MTIHPQLGLCVAIGLFATAEDLWRRQISNWIPLTGLVTGLAWNGYAHGWYGVLDALAGTAAGFLVFLVFYILGGMGGGDVKLMAGFGSILGWRGVLWASGWTAAVGGVLAITAIVGRKLWRRLVTGRGRTVVGEPVVSKKSSEPESGKPEAAEVSGQLAKDDEEDPSIPYAPAIALGALLGWVQVSM